MSAPEMPCSCRALEVIPEVAVDSAVIPAWELGCSVRLCCCSEELLPGTEGPCRRAPDGGRAEEGEEV